MPLNTFSKSDRAAAERTLDDIVSNYVKKRDKCCVICGKKITPTNLGQFHCSHLFGRSSEKLRWDIRPDGNLHTNCCTCHAAHHKSPKHSPYKKWYIKENGIEKYAALILESNQTANYKTWQLVEMIQDYAASTGILPNEKI